MSFDPSITRYPLGSTCVRRAVSVVVSVTLRLVEPDPSSDDFPERLARLAHGPPGLTVPPSASMAAVAPVATALAASATRIVTTSSVRLARHSRVKSISGADGDRIAPGEGSPPGAPPLRDC